MSRFVLLPDPVKQRRKKIWDTITIAVFTALFIIIFSDSRTAENERTFTKFTRIIFYTIMIWMPANRLFAKRHEMFVEINDQSIAYRLSEWGSDKHQLTRVAWEDIKWIKQENDFSVSVFQASSFNANFSIKTFPKDDQEKILQEIQSIAEEKQVKLVNFSELFVWDA